MTLLRSWLASLVFAAFLISIPATAAAPSAPGDRWVEFELYWFDPQAPEASSSRFWDRYAPLYRDVAGDRGVIISVGLTVDLIMNFSGDLDQPVWLPRGTGGEIGAPISGRLTGTEAERQAAWRKRFAAHAAASVKVPERSWTYGQLRALVRALKAEGARRGVTGFKVATLAVAHNNAYGEVGPFAARHPEAWTRWGKSADPVLDSAAYFDPMALLKADPSARAGLPRGIPAGTRVHQAFGAQWGATSKALGLDALMLRDSFGLPRAYTRYGPFGESLPSAKHAEDNTAGVLAMLRDLKHANPAALLMMYSSAASATADWVANGLDLERVARAGDLDIFVDQTWAGAWGEAGVRRQTYWNAPILGWTYQLQYFLQHAAVLAGSKVRHYPIVDTFDAWESWDTIHTAPDRLKWAIWAYAHAAVKTPHGLDVADGVYISWGHHGMTLLGAKDIDFLARELGDAARDARAMSDVHGPTLVYARGQMQREVAGLPLAAGIRERIDETVGTVAKWPVPILSITRLEWLDRVRADTLLFGRTDYLTPGEVSAVAEHARQGQPMAFFSGFGDGLHPLLRALALVQPQPRPSPQDRRLSATVATMPERVTNVARTFETIPPTTGVMTQGGQAAYAFGTSPALLRIVEPGLDLVLWDPIPIADFWYRPVRDLLNGDRAPFVLAAAELNAQLARRSALSADVDGARPAALAGWSSQGKLHLLAGDLEEGLHDEKAAVRPLRVRKGGRTFTVTLARERVSIKTYPRGE